MCIYVMNLMLWSGIVGVQPRHEVYFFLCLTICTLRILRQHAGYCKSRIGAISVCMLGR